MNRVNERLEKKQALWRNTNAATNHDAIVGSGCELPLKRNISGSLRSDQAKIRMPPDPLFAACQLQFPREFFQH
jgi:hypothetical protein